MRRIRRATTINVRGGGGELGSDQVHDKTINNTQAMASSELVDGRLRG